MEEIKKDFNEIRYRFSKSKINVFRRSLYTIKIRKNLSSPKIKETKRNLLELEKYLYNFKRCYDYDDNKYQGIRDIENLFDEVDKDYYKPIKSKNAFNDNYIEYESKGVKDKNLSYKGYFNMIKPYLRDMINDHETRREWKIQLTMQINFVSSKDSEETRTTHTKGYNIDLMMGNETDEIIKKLFDSLLQNYHNNLEEPMTGSDLSVVVLIY